MGILVIRSPRTAQLRVSATTMSLVDASNCDTAIRWCRKWLLSWLFSTLICYTTRGDMTRLPTSRPARSWIGRSSISGADQSGDPPLGVVRVEVVDRFLADRGC
jgi:hypothetical protein